MMSVPTTTNHPHPYPLQYQFKGYSVWLEPIQYDNDLSLAIETASQQLGILPVPIPHVTVIYGMTHLSEMEAKQRFHNVVHNNNRASSSSSTMMESSSSTTTTTKWPPLVFKGIVSDVEWEGINGGTMDMAWMEITHETSVDHEALVDQFYDAFHIDINKISSSSKAVPPPPPPPKTIVTEASAAASAGSSSSCSMLMVQEEEMMLLQSGNVSDGSGTTDSETDCCDEEDEEEVDNVQRTRPWAPHTSIAYDNPGPTPIPMEFFLNLIQRYPTLTSTQPRDIAAISLWNTSGRLDEWKCIDRIEF